MNNLLLIGLLIAPSIYCGQNEKSPRENCSDAIAVARALYAVGWKVVNVNNLRYEESLEPAIYKELSKTGGCEIPADVTIGNYQIAGALHKGNFLNPVLLQPGSTVMACVQSICMKDGKTVTTYIMDTSVDAPIHGEIGSQSDPVKVDPVGNGRRGYVRKDIDVNIPTNILDIPPKIQFEVFIAFDMNNLLLIGLLIAPSIYCGQNEKGPRERCSVDLSVNRAFYAIGSAIANMNNLRYVESLEPAIYKELSKTGGCEIPEDVTIGNYQIAGASFEPGQIENPLLLQAGSTVMACVQSICMKDARTVTTYIVDIPVDAPIHGKPGSGNGRRGYVRKDIDEDMLSKRIDDEILMKDVDAKWQFPQELKMPNPFG
ncbi:hypothetical protein CRE_22982 [Caenorhabditis remanei]|uniref:Uncharacterized protein n=1 Tax=Caenorhabditis remanei TaxID=31234 RepID=E3MW72_CAERE|nr:hypothetical protein CRE_22982 [Caenorhabditis remanei]